MNWSQLRKQVRSFICPELRERVDFHRAVYRKLSATTHDRAWVTVDGKEVFSLSHGAFTNVFRGVKASVGEQFPDATPREKSGRVNEAILASGVTHTIEFGRALHRYLESPIGESLRSDNPIIRAFALIDRRTGTRTLAKIDLALDEHPLVTRFFRLRTLQPQ